jgi:hypothetical protein
MRNRPALLAILTTAAGLAACTTSSSTTPGGSKSNGKADGTDGSGSDAGAGYLVVVECDLNYVTAAGDETLIDKTTPPATTGLPSLGETLGDFPSASPPYTTTPYIGTVGAGPNLLPGGQVSAVNGYIDLAISPTILATSPPGGYQVMSATFSLASLSEIPHDNGTGVVVADQIVSLPDFTYQGETYKGTRLMCTYTPNELTPSM